MILIILIIGLILRLILINQSLWLDEAAQVIESSRPLREQLKISGDFQPPLFHLLLHFWMRLGISEVWMRLLTVSLSVISIYLFYKIGKKLVNKNFAFLISFLLAINPFAIYYAQELRPYPMTVFVAQLAVWGLINSSSLILILGMGLFLYTTYFAPFFIAALLIYVYFFQKKKFKWFLKNTIFSILFFIPWIPSFLEQLKVGTSQIQTLPGWSEAVSTPVLKAIPLVFAKFFLGRITIDNKLAYAIVVTILTFVFFYLCHKTLKERCFLLFSCLFFIPIFLSFLTSFFLPVIDPKRILFTLPFFIGIMSSGLSKTQPFLRKFILSLIIVASLFGLVSYYTNPRFQREHWRESVSFVENKGDGTQIALFAFPEPFAPYLWYQKKGIVSYGVAKSFIVSDSDLVNLKRIIKDRNRIFVFQYLSELTDPGSRIQKTLEEEGYICIETYDFPGVGFIFQYDKASLALAS